MSILGEVGSVLAWPDGSGVGGSLIMTVALGVPAYLRAARKSAARHSQHLTQAALHHREKMQADAVRHDELVAQADRHHQESLDRQEVQVTAIQAHVTQQAAAIKAHVSAQAASPPPMTEALSKAIRTVGSKQGGAT